MFNERSRTAERGGPLAWGGVKTACYEILHMASDLDGFFGTTLATEMDMKCQESIGQVL
jgi:hypothetical protein